MALAATSTMNARPASAARFRCSRRHASRHRLALGPAPATPFPTSEGAVAATTAAPDAARGGGLAVTPVPGPGMAAGELGTADLEVALGSDAIFTRSPRRTGQHRPPRRGAPLLFEPA